MNLPCLIGIDRSGLVGADGDTHHGVFDISFLSAIPHLIIMTPKDALEAKKMINTAFLHFNAPYVLRFPKGETCNQECSFNETLEIGTWEKIIYNPENQLTIITYDQKVNQVFQLIQEHHLEINLINARFIKPLDKDMLNELYYTHQNIIVYETDMLIGSLGSQIAHYYSRLHM